VVFDMSTEMVMRDYNSGPSFARICGIIALSNDLSLCSPEV
jgi:hypothetical protein